MIPKKVLIFDSGILITFSLNSLLGKIKELKDVFDGEFVTTEDVRKEVVEKPLTIKKFELEALRTKRLFDDGVMKLPEILGISRKEISKKTEEISSLANNTFYGKERAIKLIDSGEASCLALSSILSERKIENIIAVDERTARMLGESPENLRRIFEEKLHMKITAKEENYKKFKEFKFLRSSELIYIAYKKGFFDLKDDKKSGVTVLDAVLYAIKSKGCSVSYEEIEEIKKIDSQRVKSKK